VNRGLFSLVLLASLAAASPGRAQDNGGSSGSDAQPGSNGDSAAADKALQNAIPLTPEMIDALAKRFNASKEAAEEATTELAVPINRQVNVSFEPGAATSIVNTVKGYPTAVSFFDSTGQPWPIQWDTNSNPAAVAGGTNCSVANGAGGGPSVAAIGFYVCTPTKGSNVLEITPVSLVPRGGLVVSLAGAPKPITFLLISGGGRYDANLSVHVADRGPDAKVDIMTEPDAPDTGAPFLTGMLQGVPPADAVPLSVQGVSPEGLQAWRLGGNVYLRTSFTLLSPEWTSSESEAGLTVYAIPDSPVVLVSVNGRTVSAELGGN
jgi:intracellular multiplication protein IcmK